MRFGLRLKKPVSNNSSIGLFTTGNSDRAGIEKYNLTEYPVVKSPIEELFAEFTTEVKARLLKEELGTFYTTWEQMKNKVENQGLLARIPYDIAFH